MFIVYIYCALFCPHVVSISAHVVAEAFLCSSGGLLIISLLTPYYFHKDTLSILYSH